MIILGTNSIKETGFNVDNSCRFNGDAYVHKAVSAGNQRTFTYSFWTKRSTLNNYDTFIGYAGSAGGGGSTARGELIFVGDGDDTLRVGFNPSASSWSNYTVSDRVFRDPSAWYNIVLKVNTTSGTEAERLKIFVNGVSQGLSGYPSQNFDTGFNVNGSVYHIGRSASGTGNFIKGYLAEAVFIDGTALDADSFGEFDSDSGIWKPINVSGLTFGNNGFYLDYEDSSALGADVSGNSNNFTVNNLTAIDQSTDTCTNNFATWNNLLGIQIPDSFSEGNLKVARTSGSWTATFSTIAASSGKFYAEVKWVQGGEFTTGFGNAQSYASDQDLNDLVSDPGGGGYLSVIYKNGVLYENGSNTGTGYSTYSSGDIIMLAMDLDNYKLYLGVNGTWGNSANPATNSNGVAIPSAYQGDFFHFAVNVHSSGTTTASGNFGSPEFSISSGNADGNGYGNFEYAVPSGYYALNTKNLAEYG